MKLATWNVNSIRSRLDGLLLWLRDARPDVVCLQELKCAEETFPFDDIAEAGYYAVVHGQKRYNGVAILAREEPLDVRLGLGDNELDDQARLISARVADLRVFSAYVPNGQTVGSEAYAYKLTWLARLRAMFERDYDQAEPLVLAGDFNVAVEDKDMATPEAWADSVLCVPEVRQALKAVRDWGFVDVFAGRHPEGGIYSWWDYRRLAFSRNDGLRLDHVYATPIVAERCASAEVDREPRKGRPPQKPSDHAPIVVELA